MLLMINTLSHINFRLRLRTHLKKMNTNTILKKIKIMW